MTIKEQILIIDGYGFIFRAYYALPALTSPKAEPVGAINGFISMLMKLLNDFKPRHAVIVLDSGEKNFRHTLYDAYKANRPPAPEDLIFQLKLLNQASVALNFNVIQKPGYEADDIIASIAMQLSALDKKSIIISSDKDLMQLIDDNISLYDPIKSQYINEEEVIKKFHVPASKVRDVQALMGDSSDNIPGVPGIGPKTASSLIDEFGSLEELLKNSDKIKNIRIKNLIESNIANAKLSWQLVGLDASSYKLSNLDTFNWKPPSHEQIMSFLNHYGFKNLVKRAENMWFASNQTNFDFLSLPSTTDIEIIEIEDQVSALSLDKQIEQSGIVSIYLDSKENLMLYLDTKKIYKLSKGDFYILDHIKSLTNPSILKISYNVKALLHKLPILVGPYEDLQLMHYVVASDKNSYDITKIISYYLSLEARENEIVTYFTKIYSLLKLKLKEGKALSLYYDIDIPLSMILYKMEKIGAKIDIPYLDQLSSEFREKLSALEIEIFKLSQKTFNISSPKQLGEILFIDMKLPYGKKSGKSTQYITGSEVLEKLSEDGHKIADLILEYRQFSKLVTTYTEALPKLADSENTRVHTTFLQTSTTTGRLSSRDPNIQNIPIRTKDGNKIRAAFIARENNLLLSADYSQIELRILSHIADVPELKQAFRNGEDIHENTAMQIFSVERNQVDAEMRRKAKAINFGIIYGISPFGLAKQLDITKQAATDYINKYFEQYPNIKSYMSNIETFAQEKGYVETIIGRRCFIPDINNKNYTLRSFAIRAAINAPIQGTNADIIKIAMINLDKILTQRNLNSRLIMQIHDELVLEVPQEEAELAQAIIKEVMENAYHLSIPLKVDINIKNNWQK
jgi:DNA polymerase-1